MFAGLFCGAPVLFLEWRGNYSIYYYYLFKTLLSLYHVPFLGLFLLLAILLFLFSCLHKHKTIHQKLFALISKDSIQHFHELAKMWTSQYIYLMILFVEQSLTFRSNCEQLEQRTVTLFVTRSLIRESNLLTNSGPWSCRLQKLK